MISKLCTGMSMPINALLLYWYFFY